MNSEIGKVNAYTDISQLKKFTIENINYLEGIKQRFSENALVRVIVISVLAVIQILLYATKENFSGSKTIDF